MVRDVVRWCGVCPAPVERPPRLVDPGRPREYGRRQV
ncbi:hypothetical protein STRAU_7179 [Streptomyces aurantiacus JA 4570]|uniref:Uncharacterized protein n=1 Tax=Streptomyces aurantiacus JA 4570 TaxID=1286094 RepID=S3ZAZ3_9ACTN|nr:hypothetical protein STRAU_7179 [Streptomyces aurantiacus JA 4570]